jgi:peptidoglycan-N-acetylglucosamine deacetylase
MEMIVTVLDGHRLRARRGRRYLRRAARLAALTCVAAAVCLGTVFISVASAAGASPALTVYRGPATHKQIALTFDDNTNPTAAIAAVEVLRKYKVPSTLFVIGYAVKSYPELTAKIVEGVSEGLFEVGDHSGSHADLSTLTRSQLLNEVGVGTSMFHTATGAATIALLRPPYGHYNSLVSAFAGEHGFTQLVLWDVGTEDWTGEPAGTIENDIVRRAHSGAIVLLHLGAPNTAAALPGIITRLRNAGYELVTVSHLLQEDRNFTDIPAGSETGVAATHLYEAKIMDGFDRTHFRPDSPFTRAQAAKVVTLVTGIHTQTIDHPHKPSFKDVRPVVSNGAVAPYPYDYVEEVAAAGLMTGSTNDHGVSVFRPAQPITRVQLARLLARMVRQFKGYPDVDSGVAPAFADVPESATTDVQLVSSLGLMTGRTDGGFGAAQPAKRGQVAVVMDRYLALPLFQADNDTVAPAALIPVEVEGTE